MIVEHALLPIRPGLESQFEAAMEEAKSIIAASPGFRSLTVSRGIESPTSYLLLVEWDSVRDHELGFRASPAYEDWREALHRFYEPFPVVEHYEPIVTAAPIAAGND